MNLHSRSLWQAAAASLCLLVANVSVAQEGDQKPEEQPAQPQRQEGERPEGQRGPRRQFTPEAMLERLDTNKDGKITKEEATEERWGFLERADADKNSEVTKEELAEFIKNMPRPQGPGQGFNPETSFKERDKNSDGKVTKDEVDAERWERWTTYDADKDGGVSLKEYTDAMARFRERFNQGRRPEGGNRPEGNRPEGERPNRPEGERPSRPERDT